MSLSGLTRQSCGRRLGLRKYFDIQNKESDFDFAKPGIIRLATPQSCKGLDFPVVLFYLDHCVPFFDDFDEEVADKMNRNMIYTAITRSIEMLHVFMLTDCSAKPICDLKDILKTEL